MGVMSRVACTTSRWQGICLVHRPVRPGLWGAAERVFVDWPTILPAQFSTLLCTRRSDLRLLRFPADPPSASPDRPSLLLNPTSCLPAEDRSPGRGRGGSRRIRSGGDGSAAQDYTRISWPAFCPIHPARCSISTVSDVSWPKRPSRDPSTTSNRPIVQRAVEPMRRLSSTDSIWWVLTWLANFA